MSVRNDDEGDDDGEGKQGLAAAEMKTGTAARHGEGLKEDAVLVPVSVYVVGEWERSP